MKKPNMHPTPWKIRYDNSDSGQSYGIGPATVEFPFNDTPKGELAHTDAIAIETAINNTYGKNINPEALAEFIEAVEITLECLKATQQSRNFHAPQLRQALKNIKFD